MNRNQVHIGIFCFVLDGDFLKRTELISLNQVSPPGLDLPYLVSEHCIIKISEEEFLLTGGTGPE